MWCLGAYLSCRCWTQSLASFPSHFRRLTLWLRKERRINTNISFVVVLSYSYQSLYLIPVCWMTTASPQCSMSFRQWPFSMSLPMHLMKATPSWPKCFRKFFSLLRKLYSVMSSCSTGVAMTPITRTVARTAKSRTGRKVVFSFTVSNFAFKCVYPSCLAVRLLFGLLSIGNKSKRKCDFLSSFCRLFICFVNPWLARRYLKLGSQTGDRHITSLLQLCCWLFKAIEQPQGGLNIRSVGTLSWLPVFLFSIILATGQIMFNGLFVLFYVTAAAAAVKCLIEIRNI